jgi:hypothetical protein
MELKVTDAKKQIQKICNRNAFDRACGCVDLRDWK